MANEPVGYEISKVLLGVDAPFVKRMEVPSGMKKEYLELLRGNPVLINLLCDELEYLRRLVIIPSEYKITGQIIEANRAILKRVVEALTATEEEEENA